MRALRGWLAGLVVAATAMAGCSESPSDPLAGLTPEERVLATTGVRGAVIDDEGIPVLDAVVWLQTMGGRNVRTDAEGRYEFRNMTPGTHILAVDEYGFAPLTYSVDVWATAIAELDFTLEPVPTDEPFHITVRESGFITCEAAFGTIPEDTQYIECGIQVEDTHEDVQVFSVPFQPNAKRVLSELTWSPGTPLAKKLTLIVGHEAEDPMSKPISVVQGLPGIRAFVAGWILDLMYPGGGTFITYVRAAPAIDEHRAQGPEDLRHPPISAGLAVEQNYDLYMTVFYYSAGAPGFTALPR